MPNVTVNKDRKGRCWYVSHKRCGITEGIFLTPEEMLELKDILNGLISDEKDSLFSG